MILDVFPPRSGFVQRGAAPAWQFAGAHCQQVRFAVQNITGNSHLQKSAILTATLTISPFGKREFDGLYLQPRRSKVLQVGFDTGGPTKVRICYAELICNHFKLLDS